ncbi:vesicle transport through interaction with t-SNAREs homolog 1A isoform X3 [Hemiscyllium ocellatum]|uniref:vesicle transport through interaction with t-SNAREs homolog 1A isoform X3 n=1 Tax=Hemiscyllium ocellatum TaxID=170820 RepID=UPI002965F0DC|nr:vesicle transport through interaction with t-SNAREs homolog 1A isoform X3 [Hemiscyllium ocellatum]
MSSDFEVYEQDFGTLTAEITNKVGRIPKLSGDDKKSMVANVEKQMEEARELLEQMDLEIREIPLQSRGLFSTRMKSYKQELEKLDKDFISNSMPDVGTIESSSSLTIDKMKKTKKEEKGRATSESGGCNCVQASCASGETEFSVTRLVYQEMMYRRHCSYLPICKLLYRMLFHPVREAITSNFYLL